MQDNLEMMLRFRVSPYISVCWRFLTPIFTMVCISTHILFVCSYQSSKLIPILGLSGGDFVVIVFCMNVQSGTCTGADQMSGQNGN